MQKAAKSQVDCLKKKKDRSARNDDLRRAREARQIFAAKFIYFFNLFLLVLRLAVERDIELDYRLRLDIALNGASLGYPGDADDLFLDIGRIDVVARDDNKSLFAAGEEQEAVLIDIAEVAREHPAHAAVVGIDSACRLV